MAEPRKARHGPPVVVGVDGSPESLEALRWADEYAELVGAPLHAVIAWEHGIGFGFLPAGHNGLQAEARRTLERAVHKVLGEKAHVSIEVLEGRPEDVLVEQAAKARLLVVGDRGYSSVAGLLLGHSGELCVRHAACSVVVVRTNKALAGS